MSKIVPIEDIKEDIKEDKNQIPSEYEGIEYTWSIKAYFCWLKYKKLILLSIFLLILLLIILLIIVSKKKSSSESPCQQYLPQDLASSVSLDCFRWLWQRTCNQYVPDNYQGFWLRSPEGERMISCIGNEERCGAGSYTYIINNMFVCNLNYRGYN